MTYPTSASLVGRSTYHCDTKVGDTEFECAPLECRKDRKAKSLSALTINFEHTRDYASTIRAMQHIFLGRSAVNDDTAHSSAQILVDVSCFRREGYASVCS
jgi:hypothetical protein